MWTTIGIIAVLVLYIIAVYNGLVARRTQSREAWATIDTQLKRRYDLIPNLVETVRAAAAHEKDTLAAVVAARNAAMTANGVADKSTAERGLTGALNKLFALGESYPTLRANENFLELQRELKDTEDKIQATRQFYNTVVLTLNAKTEMFPGNIFAKIFHFGKAQFFEMEPDEEKVARKAPTVKFD